MPFELAPIPAAPDDADHRPSAWRYLTAAGFAPVGITEVEDHLNLASEDSENYLNILIAGAVDYAEEQLATTLAVRTVLATFYNGRPLVLPRGPVIEVQSVQDRRGNYTTAFRVENAGHTTTVVPTASLEYPVSVVYRAGYETANAVPASIRLALLTHVATLYAVRESASDRTKTVVPHSLEDFYRAKRRASCVG